MISGLLVISIALLAPGVNISKIQCVVYTLRSDG